jgi:hypothetical protein
MDRFQEMQAFVRIAERQSFTQASEDLQIPRATVTNADQAHGRAHRHAAAGAHHAHRAPHAGRRGLLPPLRAAAGRHGRGRRPFRNEAPKGLLRVNLQGTLARHFVVPRCRAFWRATPSCNCTSARTTGWWTWCAKASIACCARAPAGFIDGRAARGAAAAGDGGEPRLPGEARRAGQHGGAGLASRRQLHLQRHGQGGAARIHGRWPGDDRGPAGDRLGDRHRSVHGRVVAGSGWCRCRAIAWRPNWRTAG